MKLIIKLIAILLLILLVMYLNNSCTSPNDAIRITEVQCSVFENILNGFNSLYSKSRIDSTRLFPTEFESSAVVNGRALDSVMNPKIFEKNSDPWKKSYKYLVSENRQYCAILSCGPNKRTGKLALDDNGVLTGFQRDDIYVVYGFNEKDTLNPVKVLDRGKWEV